MDRLPLRNKPPPNLGAWNSSSVLCVQSHFSRGQFFVTLWAVAHQVPLSMEFPRQTYWSGLPVSPYSRGSSWPRDQASVSWGSCVAGRFFTAEPLRKPPEQYVTPHDFWGWARWFWAQLGDSSALSGDAWSHHAVTFSWDVQEGRTHSSGSRRCSRLGALILLHVGLSSSSCVASFLTAWQLGFKKTKARTASSGCSRTSLCRVLLLVKAITRPAQIQGEGKEAPPPDRGISTYIQYSGDFCEPCSKATYHILS